MDHVLVSGQGVGGMLPGEPVQGVPGRCVYLPRFDLREGAMAGRGRGYGVQIYRWSIGQGISYFNAVAFAEMAPRMENRVVLDQRRKDAWGLPVLRIACQFNDAEIRLAKDQSAALRELADLLKVKFNQLNERPAPPGAAIHECGTARMGERPTDSVLDPHNQCWDASGLYVTDASAFPSQGAQNPTLTALPSPRGLATTRCGSWETGAHESLHCTKIHPGPATIGPRPGVSSECSRCAIPKSGASARHWQ